jgi:SAM-dependent methyltransferase
LTEPRRCPLCGSQAQLRHYRQSFEDIPGGLIKGYDVVTCADCGLGYASGLPSPEEFTSYYTGMSKYESAASSYYTTPEDRRRCASIAALVDGIGADRDAPVLDVGCSTGALLAAFKQIGFSDLEGLDPSPECAAIAQEEFGVSVMTGTAADVSRLSRRYGLIVLSAVLEHLPDPLQAVKAVRAILRKDGLVFVEVPDVEGFAAEARAPFQEFSVEHINFFSLRSRSNRMGSAGFDAVILERRLTPWRSGLQVPALHAVFRAVQQAVPVLKDESTDTALHEYVAASERIEASVRARIEDLADREVPILVWGVGTHTRHLLKTGALDRLQIVAYVDSDPKYQGTVMRGAPVLAPHDLVGRTETILVSSGTVHQEIAHQIRHELGSTNEVVLLYD